MTLPTEHGIYADSGGYVWRLDEDDCWIFLESEGRQPHEPVEKFAPFTRLVPEPLRKWRIDETYIGMWGRRVHNRLASRFDTREEAQEYADLVKTYRMEKQYQNCVTQERQIVSPEEGTRFV